MQTFQERAYRGKCCRLNSRLSALRGAVQVSCSQLRALLIYLAVHMYSR